MTEPTRPTDVRKLFPVLERCVYFNHAATGPLPLTAVAAMDDWNRRCAEEGEVPWDEAEAMVGETRVMVARLMGVRTADVAFTKNTSSGIIIAIGSVEWRDGDNVVLMEDAFPAVNYPFAFLLPRVEKRWVTSEELVRGSDCVFDRTDDRTRMVALPWVHFLTGRRFDVTAIARFCRERGIVSVVDAIQGLGVVPSSFGDVGADFVCSHGAKWLVGPQGSGFMAVRPGILPQLRPYNLGWLSADWTQFNDIFSIKPLRTDARQFEEGTKNYIAIRGLQASLGLFLETGLDSVWERVRGLVGRLRAGLERAGFEFVTPGEPDRSAGIVTCHKPGCRSASFHAWLRAGGMVCALREDRLRISPHFYSTGEEVDRFLERITMPEAETAVPTDCPT